MPTILPLYSLNDSIAHVIEDNPNAITTEARFPSGAKEAANSAAAACDIANNAPHRTLVFT